jgi:hypothetical protein
MVDESQTNNASSQPQTATRVPPLPNQGSNQPQLGDNAGIRMLLPVGRSGWAIAAGYVGLVSVLLLPAPIAMILSIVAIVDIRKSKSQAHPKHGLGRAIFGLIMGSIFTILGAWLLIELATPHRHLR